MRPESAGALAPLSAAALIFIVLLGGCGGGSLNIARLGQQSSGGGASSVEAIDFEDIRLPSDSEILYSDSLVFGQGRDWYGRLALRSPLEETELVDFFRTNLALIGWQELSAMRSATSVIVFVRDSRMLALEIATGSLGTSSVIILVSPMSGGGALPFAG